MNCLSIQGRQGKPPINDGASLSKRFAVKKKPRVRWTKSQESIDIRDSTDVVLPSIERLEVGVPTESEEVPEIFNFDVEEDNINNHNIQEPTPPLTPEQYRALRKIFTTKISILPAEFIRQAATDFAPDFRTTQLDTSPENILSYRCRDGFEGTEVIPNGPGLQITAKRRRRNDGRLGELQVHKGESGGTKKVRFEETKNDEKASEILVFEPDDYDTPVKVHHKDQEVINLRSKSPDIVMANPPVITTKVPKGFELRPAGQSLFVVPSSHITPRSQGGLEVIPPPILSRPRSLSPFSLTRNLMPIDVTSSEDIILSPNSEYQDAVYVLGDGSEEERLEHGTQPHILSVRSSPELESLPRAASVFCIPESPPESYCEDEIPDNIGLSEFDGIGQFMTRNELGPEQSAGHYSSPELLLTEAKIDLQPDENLTTSAHYLSTPTTPITQVNRFLYEPFSKNQGLNLPTSVHLGVAKVVSEPETRSSKSMSETESGIEVTSVNSGGLQQIFDNVVIKSKPDVETPDTSHFRTSFTLPGKKSNVPWDGGLDSTSRQAVTLLTSSSDIHSLFFCPESAEIVRQIMDEATLMDERDQVAKRQLHRSKTLGAPAVMKPLGSKRVKSQVVGKDRGLGLKRVKSAGGKAANEQQDKVLTCFGQLEME